MSLSTQQEFLQRFKKFAQECAEYVKSLPLNEINRIYGKQLIRSSSSVPANYAESMCSLTRNDWIHDVNKSRKEANESETWLDLLVKFNEISKSAGNSLQEEAKQIVKILSKTIISARKS